jgi:hypothetical protein
MGAVWCFVTEFFLKKEPTVSGAWGCLSKRISQRSYGIQVQKLI